MQQAIRTAINYRLRMGQITKAQAKKKLAELDAINKKGRRNG